MEILQFSNEKRELESAIKKHILTDTYHQGDYEMLLNILSSILYEHSVIEQGRLTHFIIDSYNGDKILGMKIIDFDEKLKT